MTASRAQQRTCTSWQWWEGGATPMGCRGCLGLLMAEVSLAEFFFLSACAIVHACAYSSDGPKSIFKTKQISPLDAYPAANWPREPNISGFNLGKLVSQYKHEPTLSYQGQLVQQPIFLSPNPSPLSIRFKWALQLCLYKDLTTTSSRTNKNILLLD